MRSRISIRGCIRPYVRPSMTHALKSSESAVIVALFLFFTEFYLSSAHKSIILTSSFLFVFYMQCNDENIYKREHIYCTNSVRLVLITNIFVIVAMVMHSDMVTW